jgi:hypothetical protein
MVDGRQWLFMFGALMHLGNGLVMNLTPLSRFVT